MPAVNNQRNNRQNAIGRNAKNGAFFPACQYILIGGKKPPKNNPLAAAKNRGNPDRHIPNAPPGKPATAPVACEPPENLSHAGGSIL
jgi:hypothetical protein